MQLLDVRCFENLRRLGGGRMRRLQGQRSTCPVRAKGRVGDIDKYLLPASLLDGLSHAENLQQAGMRKANRSQRRQPGLSEALLRFGMPEDRQTGTFASEKIAAGKPAMLPLRAKTDARCSCRC
jgi:hypothetical protein